MKNIKIKHFDKILVISIFLITVILYHISPSQYISDDSIFYLVIAEYIVESGFSSFNGYISTNGYHPLWMLFNVLSIKISTFLNIEPLNIIGLIYQLFLAGAIYILFKIEDITKAYYASVVSIILLFLFLSNGALHNMESSLALFFVLYILYYILTENNPTNKKFFLFGILLGLTILSRLDLVFFGLLTTSYIVIKHRNLIISSPKKLIYFILGGLLIVIPYFIYNEFTFGAITPISGALKSSFPNINFSLHNIFPYGIVTSFFALIALAIATISKSKKSNFIFILLSLSTLMHSAYLVMFQDAMTWYYITGFLVTALVIGYLIKMIKFRNITYLFLFLLTTLTISTSYLKLISDYTLSNHILKGKQLNFSQESQMKVFATTLKEKLPKNSSIFTWDAPGILAYYGRFRIFSADGLITNKIYQKELVNQGAKKIFQRYDINYILVPLTNVTRRYYDGMLFQPLKDKKYLITIYSRLYHKQVGTLKLSEKDILFTLPSPYSGTDDKSALIAVFKIPTKKNNIWIIKNK